jgi:hypothetical protein
MTFVRFTAEMIEAYIEEKAAIAETRVCCTGYDCISSCPSVYSRDQVKRMLPSMRRVLHNWNHAFLVRVFDGWRNWFLIRRMERIQALEVAQRTKE